MNKSQHNNLFVVVLKNGFEWNGKTVMFRIEIAGQLRSLIGKFKMHRDAETGNFRVDIDSQELIQPTDPPLTAGWRIHLCQAHIDSIVPAKQNDLGVNYAVEIPFESRDYIPSTEHHLDAS